MFIYTTQNATMYQIYKGILFSIKIILKQMHLYLTFLSHENYKKYIFEKHKTNNKIHLGFIYHRAIR